MSLGMHQRSTELYHLAEYMLLVIRGANDDARWDHTLRLVRNKKCSYLHQEAHHKCPLNPYIAQLSVTNWRNNFCLQ